LDCAHPAPPVRFAASPAFQAIDSTVYGILEADLNNDGLPDGIAVQDVGSGFVPVVYLQAAGNSDGTTWSRDCTGDRVAGEEIETLRWVDVDGRELVLLTASDRNPDEATVDGALFDPRDGCRSRYRETLVLNEPNGVILAPGSVPGGFVITDAGSVRLVDRARYLTLGGAEGEVALLRDLRVRDLRWHHGQLVTESQRAVVVVPRRIEVQWLSPDAGATDAPELLDGDDHTLSAIRPHEVAALALVASEPILMLEIHHGCPAAALRPLELAVADSKAYRTGARPEAGSFVRASGRGRVSMPSVQLDLLALLEPTSEIALTIGPTDAERCVREVKGYGFLDTGAVGAVGGGTE
jgi:hypothetical protein